MSDELMDQLYSIKDYIRYAASRIEAAGLYYTHATDNAVDEAVALTLALLKLPHDFSTMLWDARLIKEEKERLLAAIVRRTKERCPLAYITNVAWFANLKFYVDERVMIPRSSFDELILKGFEPWVSVDQSVNRILDVCSGSGNIAIACAYAFPEAQVDAVELDTGAFLVARQNVKTHQLDDWVEVIKSDLFAEVQGRTYDMIIATPPDMDTRSMAGLPPECLHEPRLSLEAGDDGLRVVRRILREARQHLTEEGMLFVEINHSQEALIDEFPDVPFRWIDFENGSSGAFMLTASDLDCFANLLEQG